MKNAIFWDVALLGSCKNQHFRGLIASIIKVNRISEIGTTSEVTHK
jgi:hypothetical protein